MLFSEFATVERNQQLLTGKTRIKTSGHLLQSDVGVGEDKKKGQIQKDKFRCNFSRKSNRDKYRAAMCGTP